MKLNNKGFALTSIIYMLIVLFLMILLLILANLATRKVVLDKIKNDVKENLNQGGLLAQNTYTVTFDPTIGQINQKTKQVKYNEPYGELPTPTREGYKFIGWTSKNLAPEINESNYTSDHFNNRTTTEFRNENGTNYIRINGNPSNENIDTMWRIYPVNKKALYQGNYILSFDIRSQNSPLTQNIMKKIDRNSGKTGIYIDDATKIDNMISNIENDYNFDNDGQWHHFTSLVTIPYDISNALIVIGNDKPNLYGPNSYIDIKNIQLEPGNTATEYEPYFGNITSDTIVTRGENHTLYAMWTEIPKLTLSKETYVDIPFDNTWTYSNATVEDNVLTLGSDGNDATATTDFINVNNDFWYVTMDGYTEVTLPDKDKNGVFFNMFYYNSNKSATNALSGTTNNGSAINLDVGSWQNNLTYNHPDYGRYGPNVNYIKLDFRSGATIYSKPPIKLRNIKVYGQMPNSFYLINVEATDADGIDVIKYAKGIQNIDYFKDNGTVVENNQARVTENGTYTVYARDTKGGENIKTIEIINIQ